MTALVVLATGNHYVLDVVAGGVLVWLAVALERARAATVTGRVGQRVAAPDEFFLHVEAPTVQQPVGGFVLLDRRQATGPLDLPAIRALLTDRVARMPRFRQRLEPAGRWRHARWVRCEPDIDWHVREHVLAGGGRAALAAFVSRLAEQELDRRRPMWQIWFVPDVGPGEAAAVGIVHHAFADGLGVVDILRQMFEPELPPPDLSGVTVPPLPVRAGAGAFGLVQLAADGVADRLPFAAPLSGRRCYRIGSTPFAPVRELARRTGTTITDVLLAATGTAVSRALVRGGVDPTGRRLRAAVPVTTRVPAPAGTGRRAEPGNLTAALRLDVPLDPGLSPLERLRATAEAARARRRSGRALATTVVMHAVGVLPPPVHRVVARAMYQRRFFTAIVSNMPGPSAQLSMAGAPIRDVYPILPLAEGVPLGVGTLGWAGQFCVSVLTDPARLPDADLLVRDLLDAVEGLQHELDSAGGMPSVAPVLHCGVADAAREEVPSSPTPT